MARQLLADIVRSEYPGLVGTHAAAHDTPIVVADDVATWLNTDRQGIDSAADAIMSRLDGPLAYAPPMYDEFWVEGEFPPPVDRDGGYRVGVFVSTTKSTRNTDMLTVRTWGWVLNGYGLQLMDVGGIEYYVGRDGAVLAAARGGTRADGARAIECTVLVAPWADGTRRKHLRGLLLDDQSEALMALQMAEFVIATCAFAICRNVRPEHVDVPPKVARKRARALGLAEPTLGYSRIALPGFREWRTASRLAAGAGPQTLPVHLVRAHPKTYRRNADGSGGLGRFHAEGTWLWSASVRGSAEWGRRVPHVTVSVPESEDRCDPEK